jgi:hypothetical protein
MPYRRTLIVVCVSLLALFEPAAASFIGYTTESVIDHYRSLDHSEISQGRADLISDGHTLVPVNGLAPGSLSGLDTLVVGVVSDGYSLSSAQVDVVEDFVLAGGKLVFIGENNKYFHANNVTVGGRFGIAYPTVDPSATILSDVPLPRHPIMAGPYGQVDIVDGSNNTPGFFGSMSSPGPYGRSILNFPGGNSAAVVIEPGALGVGSGPVVAFATVNIWDNEQYFTADNRALWRNTFAYIPEPATLGFFAAGALLVLRRRRQA